MITCVLLPCHSITLYSDKEQGSWISASPIMRHFLLVTCRYAANIEKIDYEGEKVLIHYRQWSHRYDEWFDWTSPYLRPVERVQLRRKGAQDDSSVPVSLERSLSSLSSVLHTAVGSLFRTVLIKMSQQWWWCLHLHAFPMRFGL